MGVCNGANVSGYGVTPDLRERFILGGSGDDLRGGINTKGGEKEHKLTTEEMPSHNHWMDRAPTDDRNFTGTGRANYQEYGLVADAGSYKTDAGEPPHYPGKYTTNTGGDKSHNNMPPYYVLVYIIKVA